MVTIKKGSMTKKVTEGAFANYYKDNGWAAVNGSPAKSKKVKEVPEVPEETEEDEWAEAMKEEVEKPIDEMTRKELEQKAIDLGIDLTGLGKTAQIREAIRAYLS